jgi:hypothetical protein
MRPAFGLGFVLLVSVAQSWATANVPNLQYDAEVPQSLRAQVKTDLTFLAGVTGQKSTPLHQKVFGKVDGAAYMLWFKNRITAVGVSLCGSDTAVACVLSAWENKMWFSPNYTAFQNPQIARLSVIYHEARHTESEEHFWPHAKCPQPFLDESGMPILSIWTGATLAGESACDLDEFGSYGVQTLFLKNISLNCTNCTEKIKADADLYANSMLKRIIWVPARTRMKQDFGMQAL